MAQIVISFGSEQLDCIKSAILKVIRGQNYTAAFTTARKVEEMAFISTDENLEPLADKLSAGSITNVCLQMKDRTPIQFVNLFAPNFCGASLTCWQGIIEYKEDDFEAVFDVLLSFACLRYVCVGMEEGPELEQHQMRLETFPFDEEPLVVSAFKMEDGSHEWVIRRGPSYQTRQRR